MAEYKIEKDGNLTTIWDEAEGIGLQFAEGDTLQAIQDLTGNKEGVKEAARKTFADILNLL